MAREGVVLGHHAERVVKVLLRNAPGDEGALRQVVGQERLANPADHAGPKERAYAFNHGVCRDAGPVRDLANRIAMESSERVLRDGQDLPG